MTFAPARLLAGLARIASLVLLAALGTVALMRFAPGYFTDSREMDAQYASGARAALETQQQQQGSFLTLTKSLAGDWLHGHLGRSRQYDVPVTELLAPRIKTTAKLLAEGIALGWLAAFLLALPLSARRARGGEALIAAPSAILLAVPVGALAIACMVANIGGPLLVLTAIIAARDFKFVYRLLRETWRSPHLLYASALGTPRRRIVIRHLLPPLRLELFGLAMMSLVLALSAIVPIEVIFDTPGLGQLAWSAAMNRDLPVLLAVTLLVATCIGLAGAFTEPARRMESIQCA